VASDIKTAQEMPPAGGPPPAPQDPAMAAPMPPAPAPEAPAEPQDERPLPEILEEIKKDVEALSMKLDSGDMMLDGQELEHFEPDSGAMPAPAPKIAAPGDAPRPKTKNVVIPESEGKFGPDKTDVGPGSTFTQEQEKLDRQRRDELKLQKLETLAKEWGFKSEADLIAAYHNFYKMEPDPSIPDITEEQAHIVDQYFGEGLQYPGKPIDRKEIDRQDRIEESKQMGKSPYSHMTEDQLVDEMALTIKQKNELRARQKLMLPEEYKGKSEALRFKIDELNLALDKLRGDTSRAPKQFEPFIDELTPEQQKDLDMWQQQTSRSNELFNKEKDTRVKSKNPRSDVEKKLVQSRDEVMSQLSALPPGTSEQEKSGLYKKIKLLNDAIALEQKKQPKIDLKDIRENPDDNEIKGLSQKKLFLMNELRNLDPSAPDSQRKHLRTQIDGIEKMLESKRPSIKQEESGGPSWLDETDEKTLKFRLYGLEQKLKEVEQKYRETPLYDSKTRAQLAKYIDELPKVIQEIKDELELREMTAPVDPVMKNKVKPQKTFSPEYWEKKIKQMAADQANGIGAPPDWEAAKKTILNTADMPIEQKKRNIALIDRLKQMLVRSQTI
jgi:hypothetical protein